MGDDEFELFYERNVDRALRLAYLVCGDAREAEDIVADAVASVYRRWKGGYVDDLFPYLRTAIVNHGTGRIRRLARERRTSQYYDQPCPSRPFDDAIADRDALRRAVMSLPRRQRAALVLRYYEGLSERETAGILNVREGTVKAHLSRAVHRLRLELTKETQT